MYILSESSEVVNLQSESTNDTTLVISWEPPASPNGYILNYSVIIINLADGSTVRQGNTANTNITLGKLGITCLILKLTCYS
jgi:hypothetical protein